MANSHDQDHDKIDAFFRSPIGFWISISVIVALAIGGIVLTFIPGAHA